MKTTMKHNEQGIVAIVVTMIILLIISITTLGFAQLARREQRQSLDRQLSTAALYAAESGINDAVYAMKCRPGVDPLCTTAFLGAKTSCDRRDDISPTSGVRTGQTMTLPVLYGGRLGGVSSSSEYTCVLINPSPTSLEYSSIATTQSTRVDFTLSGAPSARYIVIGWSGDNTFLPDGTTPLTFPAASAWGLNAPVLRVDLTNLSGNNYTRDGMINNTYTGYFYPEAGGAGENGTTTMTAANMGNNRGEIVTGQCFANRPVANKFRPQDCNVVINVDSLNSNHFMLRLQGVYKDARVTVMALADTAAEDPMSINGGQTIVDATGKANDVLKRQQVRISSQPTRFPDYAVQSADSICKRLLTGVAGTLMDPTITGSDAAANGPCRP